jgi:hypothetical protein
MITAFEIENFKGVRERVRIDLKPITLLFGPNSGGKSTILHALHYAREVFQRRNLDADQTAAGGRFADLGGFRNFVHGRDLTGRVRLGFDITFGADLPTYTSVVGEGFAGTFLFEDPSDLSTAFDAAKVEIAVAYSSFTQRVFVEEYKVTIKDHCIAELKAGTGVNAVIHWDHPLLASQGEDDLVARTSAALAARATRTSTAAPVEYTLVPVERQEDALPTWGQAVPLILFPDGEDVLAETFSSPAECRRAADLLLAALSQLIVGPGELLAHELGTFRYLGPVREIPPRNFVSARSPDVSRWASGLAAWDALLEGSEQLVSEASAWLSRPDRLDTGYRVERRRYKKLDAGDPLLLALVSGRAFDDLDAARIELDRLPEGTDLVLVSESGDLGLDPSDVGIGISQVLPVIVAALAEGASLVLIEQPELHIHPRLQAELGDLFIEVARKGRVRFILETHSEHLVLRMLRRIRQTGEGELPPGHAGLEPAQLSVAIVDPPMSHPDGIRQGTRVHQPRIDNTGEFLDQWPHGFFEERAKELF